MRKFYCNEINESLVGQEVQVCGWVNKIRDHGGVIFIDLRDAKGLVQVVVNPDINELYTELKEEEVNLGNLISGLEL